MKLNFLLLITLFHFYPVQAGEDLWNINPDGSISWKIDKRVPHADHIEMSGQMISAIIRYSVSSEKSFHCSRSLVWPMLRTIPNNTRASLNRFYDIDIIRAVNINGKPMKDEEVNEIILNGFLTVKSTFNKRIEVKRILFPSPDKPAYCERYILTNKSPQPLMVEIPYIKSVYKTDSLIGVYGTYRLTYETNGNGTYTLREGETHAFEITIKGEKMDGTIPKIEVALEEKKRQTLIKEWWENLVIETPDEVLNHALSFAKIRASESIFKTQGGLMHGPGGEAYYAAIWANDQAEYIGPFFPYLGYKVGNEASLNAYMHFARFMNSEYNPIPSSIIAEGTDIWHGAGDRGDGAMIAYGASRYALSLGDRQTAKQLWPLIEWCLEFCRRKININGVVASDSDELEGRFPAGDANLCTSSLYYDALCSAIYLGKDLGKPAKQLKSYEKQATAIKKAIESHFGANVEGFNTYRYYEGNEVLRSWICMPLTVDIFTRKQETINALFSPRLWTDNGLLTQAGDSTFWDRSTLYALRGVFAAGEKDKALEYLKYYSRRRLLGNHVPYPIEAYPEGNQRHLSAESGLYCRIFTEGLFGIRPTGLRSFSLTPQLPVEWNEMALRNIHGFGEIFDLYVSRSGKGRLSIKVTTSISNEEKTFTIKEGGTLTVKFPNVEYNPGPSEIISGLFPEMVFIEGSLFKMGNFKGQGDDDELPWHMVKLSDFSIAKTEITVQQWRYYCSSIDRQMPATPAWGWEEQHPIVNVSWQDAADYCQWLSAKTGKRLRLPTEAEWEFAAHGGKKSKEFVYSGGSVLDMVGFYKSNSPSQTQIVAQKLPNELGLFDMSGNAWEWCADWYANKYPNDEEITDPKGPLEGSYRIIRGGGWVAPEFDCRITNRWRSDPGVPTDYIGFRPVSY